MTEKEFDVMMARRIIWAIKWGIIGGIVASIILVISVFATGQTFGQRCAKQFPNHSVEWKQCVHNLVNGK